MTDLTAYEIWEAWQGDTYNVLTYDGQYVMKLVRHHIFDFAFETEKGQRGFADAGMFTIESTARTARKEALNDSNQMVEGD